MVPGLILAAGRSTRMGRPKALLAADSTNVPFVVRLGRSLLAGGVDGLVVVGRTEDPDLRRVVERDLPAARFVVNPEADEGGQLSSLLAGIDGCAEQAAGVLVTPVDVPLVSAASVAALLSAFRAAPGRIVRAVHLGAHGHPVIFPREVFEELRRADPSAGAKAVLRADPNRIVDLEVPDPGVVHDVDTPGDYARLRGEQS